MDIKIGHEYIGERENTYMGNTRCFITLPENNIYPEHYGFYISGKLVDKEYIYLLPNYDVDLQISPEYREKGKRYKHFKMTGEELYNNFLKDYEENLEKEYREREHKKKEAQDKRFKKIYGNIVYGKYVGSIYDEPDYSYDYFFCKDGTYYNGRHKQVKNVDVKLTILENKSKYYFTEVYHSIKLRLVEYIELTSLINSLKGISIDCSEEIKTLTVKKDKILSDFEEYFKIDE